MSTPNTEVAVAEKPMEFIPFGGKDAIKLTVKIIQNLVAVKTRSGKTCSDNDAIKFMLMCRARLLNPFEGDAFLIGYDSKDGPSFSLITAHQAFLKRAELNAEYDGMESGVIVRDGDEGAPYEIEGDFHLPSQTVLGGWARVHFKNRKHPMYKRVRLARFQKSFGVWQDDPAGMIVKCGEADALRSAFPTMLGGLYLREEQDIAGAEPKVSKPLFSDPPVVDVPPSQPEPVIATERPPEGHVFTQSHTVETKPVEPVAGTHSKAYNKVKAIEGMMKIANVKEEELLACLCEIGVIDSAVTALKQVAPDVIDMVESNCNDLMNKVKEARVA